MKRLQKCSGVLLIAVIAGCNFSFGSNKIDPKKVEKSIKTSLDSKLAGKLDGKPIVVECPNDEVIKEGATFDCAVTAGDHKLVAKITQEDSKGTIAWEITEGLIDINFRYGTQDLIAQYIASNLGVPDAEVKCPEKIEVKKGGKFECSALIDGVKVTAAVEQTNDEGNVSYKLAGGVVFTDKLRMIVEAELKAKQIAAKVDCGTPILLSKPGSKFQCNAVDSNGKTATVEVLIKDSDGDVSWNLVVPDTAAASK